MNQPLHNGEIQASKLKHLKDFYFLSILVDIVVGRSKGIFVELKQFGMKEFRSVTEINFLLSSIYLAGYQSILDHF